ncbi:MAG: hypothetical protein IAI49_03695, partial [Candidatus Eremiobacteraeota bacterium]|nr:hypothetical protein [Candidatus Eremiobacteraeota bacterium]
MAAAVAREAARLGRVAPPRAVARDLFYEEIYRSTALAGARLTADEVRDLVD